MQPENKHIVLAAIAVIALAVVILWFADSHSMPELNVTPVPKGAPTLNEADVEKVLGVEQFRIVRRVRQIPDSVKESFSNFTGLPFDLADPGEQIGTDLVIPGKSSRRLAFLGINNDSALLVYEQGGRGDYYNAVIFWFGDGGRGWAASSLGDEPKNIPDLRASIQRGDFHEWGRHL